MADPALAGAPGCMPPTSRVAVFMRRPSELALAKAPSVLSFRKRDEQGYSDDLGPRTPRLAFQAEIEAKEVPKIVEPRM
jgi:hypothetical protein